MKNPKSTGRMRKLFIIALLSTMWVACSKDQTASDEQMGAPTIYASIEEPSTSRVQLNEQKQTVWTAGDEIIIYEPDQLTLWRFQGETGDRGGTFQRVGKYGVPDNYASVGFQGHNALFSSQSLVSYGADAQGGLIFTQIEATQTYEPHSYGVKANLMFGHSDDGSSYSFMNLLGYLRLSLTGAKKVQKIELWSNDNEQMLAGIVYFSPNSPTQLMWSQNFAYTLTLDCGEGVQLSSQPTDFYFAMKPDVLANGITVQVYFTDGSFIPKTTGKSITIERNAIQPMATFSTGDNLEWQTTYIWHTGNYIAAPRILYYPSTPATGIIEWGDGSTSMANMEQDHDYTDGKPSHTVVVKSSNAVGLSIEGLKGVTKIDLSNL